MITSKSTINIVMLILFFLIQLGLAITSMPQSYRVSSLVLVVLSFLFLLSRAKLNFISLWGRLALGNKFQHFTIAIMITLFSPLGDLSILGMIFIFLLMLTFSISLMSVEKQ